MTRADVIKLFPDATEEQITSALNAFHKEIDDAKDKAKSVRDENAAKVAELQAQLDELNSKDDSELEKVQKQLDKLNGDYEKAQKTIRDMELKNGLLGQGVSEEDANKLIETMSADKFDPSVIGTLIANAISAHDKEKMTKTPDPSGAQGKADTRTDAEKIAEAMYGNSDKSNSSVISNYL